MKHYIIDNRQVFYRDNNSLIFIRQLREDERWDEQLINGSYISASDVQDLMEDTPSKPLYEVRQVSEK